MSLVRRCTECDAGEHEPHHDSCSRAEPIPDELYLRMTHSMLACDHYRFWDAVANHLANYVAWEPLAFALRKGLETIPTKED